VDVGVPVPQGLTGESVPGTWIVRFNTYKDAAVHRRVARCLLGRGKDCPLCNLTPVLCFPPQSCADPGSWPRGHERRRTPLVLGA